MSVCVCVVCVCVCVCVCVGGGGGGQCNEKQNVPKNDDKQINKRNKLCRHSVFRCMKNEQKHLNAKRN